ncbi:MAG: L,D-transpeptidase family protein [Sulfurovum sp.]|nr:L,D-transpeptidase family protein [Sulfurovum sp.]
MSKSLTLLFTLVLSLQYLSAGNPASTVLPLSKSKFAVKQSDGTEKIVDLAGQNYIVASLRERGADGAAYAIDSDGVIWWAAIISSGAKGHETPSGIFNIFRKERFYMSKTYPEASGINNMDFSLWFTPQGHAIHMGNDAAMSHGCIHVGAKGASSMFNWAKANKTKVVVTREHFMPFAYYDLLKAGYKETSKTPAHIKAAIRALPHVKPNNNY